MNINTYATGAFARVNVPKMQSKKTEANDNIILPSKKTDMIKLSGNKNSKPRLYTRISIVLAISDLMVAI